MKRSITNLYMHCLEYDFPSRNETRMTKAHTRLMKDERRYVRRKIRNRLKIKIKNLDDLDDLNKNSLT